jgi:signal peptidase I
MEPTLREGDWLLVDPTTVRWPRPGSIVAFLEPDTGVLAVKRVAAGPRTRVPFADGYLELADDEAWLTADATPEVTAEAELGPPRDSERYGPVPVAMLVGRVWFRYAPLRRIGPVRRQPSPAGPSDSASPG